jgi:hypothetical protein
VRRPLALTLAMTAVLATGCRLDAGADPDRDPATAEETLPEDAGQLGNPSEVVSPGGGSGETADDAEAGGGATADAEG